MIYIFKSGVHSGQTRILVNITASCFPWAMQTPCGSLGSKPKACNISIGISRSLYSRFRCMRFFGFWVMLSVLHIYSCTIDFLVAVLYKIYHSRQLQVLTAWVADSCMNALTKCMHERSSFAWLLSPNYLAARGYNSRKELDTYQPPS